MTDNQQLANGVCPTYAKPAEIDDDDGRIGLPSASSMERHVNCPASMTAQRGLPELAPQQVTTEGTDIHRAMETGDATGMEESAQEIAVRLERLELKAVAIWSDQNELTQHERSQLVAQREQRLWMRDKETLQPLASAKLDVFYTVRNLALLLDFKSGFKQATPSERNWQLLTQAICLHHEQPGAIEEFTVGIAASRLTSTLDTARYAVAALAHPEFVIKTATWRAQQPNPPRIPGTWCQYCRAKGVCPNAVAWSTLQLENPKLGGKLSMLTEISNMTPEQMKFIWIKSTVAKGILDAVKARLEHQPEATLTSLGLRLKPGAEVRKIKDISAARSRLSVILTTDQIDQCSSLAIGKLVTAARKDGITAKQAEAVIETALEGVIEKSQNKPSLEEI